MKKSMCLFCGKDHRKTPPLCHAKGKVIEAYAKALAVDRKSTPSREMWRVLYGIQNGLIDLELDAKKFLKQRGAG
jgi:hypothetical protein